MPNRVRQRGLFRSCTVYCKFAQCQHESRPLPAAHCATLSARVITQTAIGEALDIHPSQVSRICAGDFKRLDGNALRVCKYAQQVAARTQAGRGPGRVAGELEGKLTQLLVASPDAALAVGALIDALLATSPADTAAAGA